MQIMPINNLVPTIRLLAADKLDFSKPSQPFKSIRVSVLFTVKVKAYFISYLV